MEEQLNELETQTLETGEEIDLDLEAEEAEPTNDTQDESPEALKKRAEEAETRAKKLYARLQAEKAKGKDVKPKAPQKSNSPSSPGEDELFFIAGGGTKAELLKLRTIQKGEGISFDEALKDPMFVAFREKLQAEKKKEAAQLGGSNRLTPQKRAEVKRGMSEQEHMEAWRKATGQA